MFIRLLGGLTNAQLQVMCYVELRSARSSTMHADKCQIFTEIRWGHMITEKLCTQYLVPSTCETMYPALLKPDIRTLETLYYVPPGRNHVLSILDTMYFQKLNRKLG